MANNKIPAHVLQAYLAQTPPDTEINLTTLGTELADNSLQQALDFFSTLPEHQKVRYIVFLYNYYYYSINKPDLGEYTSLLFEPQEVFPEDFITEVEDFFGKYNLNVTELVPIRRLIAGMQKLTAKQRQHRKEGFPSES